ncbi:hypothetical protein [Pleomorphomonas sp. JP5]|uniref:hypothetical protein n=1 Tax=Pleomorphomonas sp. JP5 TaxID=2942998 RepID=UPI002043755F|nr:hypothetical protein [Pleomorphomonas sp. JP5]MCM5557228.1 hypothetical protein [Pleomorphomonas sp. JP5]
MLDADDVTRPDARSARSLRPKASTALISAAASLFARSVMTIRIAYYMGAIKLS